MTKQASNPPPPNLPVVEQTKLKAVEALATLRISCEIRSYFRAETGTGKSSAILHLVTSNTGDRFVIAVPYVDQVDSMWRDLGGSEDFCGWTRVHDANAAPPDNIKT